ncbi:MAG TPA: glycosyltransferase family 9 protein [Acidimicrobiales bacterium]|nr:glycosyltransferase family 9 protein [Acidimicrobiales bacterium]
MTGPGPVLVALRPLKLGDYLTAVPALRALADAYPTHRRLLAAPGWLEPLSRHVGAFHRLVPTEPLATLEGALYRADVAVDLHGRGDGSQPVLLAARPRRLICFANPDVGTTGPLWREDEHEVARWCRLLSSSGVPADPSRLDIDPPAVPVPATARGATVVHPGAASGARRWPVERFAALVRRLRARGERVVVTGGPSEVALAARLVAMADLAPEALLAGRTGLLELAAVVAAASRVVCGDTGVAHLATALGTPSVVLFGPVPPTRWGPPPDRPWHRALWSGRCGDPHGATVDPGLLELSVAQVLRALEDLPGRDEPAA